MRILFAFHMDPRNPHAQSGRPNGILKEMLRNGHEVDILVTPRAPLGQFTLRKALSILTGRRCGTERSPRNSRFYAGAVTKHLAAAGDRYDLLFSPNTWLFADLDHPIVKIADVDILIDEYIRTYLADRRIDPFYIREANENEQRALSKLDLLIVPSRCTEENARRFYGMHADRVVRIAHGGNLGVSLGTEEAQAVIEHRLSQPKIEFLFIGREWHRKNGELVARTCEAIARQGVGAHAHFVGVDRPRGFPSAWNEFSTFHGHIDLRVPEGVERLTALANRSSFFFTPSRAEAYGLSFAEAAALALPLIGSTVGGIPDLVTPGNGLLVDPEGDPEEIAAGIIAIRGDAERYRRISNAVLEDSRVRLNWRSFWQKLEPLLQDAVSRRKAAA